ncbi:hypothetical protein [Actibacterium sp. 188UL27-1]|uniref:hypothetical protein n=1 Tax=Actibacterium sp. 188UL27-1 TaxID=2786961 RepID=UPI001EF5E23A|nr:hypothetical protein [Actibacterium sp. 188UL27-1]
MKQIAAGERPDDLRSEADVAARYARLDQMFEETLARGRFLLRRHLPECFRDEHGGVLIHIGRDGTCLRSGGGIHRMAIAKILNLPEMPAQIGAIHPDAIRDGHLQRLMVSRLDPGAGRGSDQPGATT